MKAWYYVALKEIVSTWRDKRTIRNVLVLPVLLMPLFMYGPAFLMSDIESRTQATVQKVGVRDLPPEVLELFAPANLEPIPVDDPKAAVEAERVDAAIVWRDGRFVIYAMEGAKPVKAGLVVAKVRRVLDRYKDALVAERLRAVGLDPGVLEPFEVEVSDVSPPEAQGAGVLGGMIPYFLMLFIMMGAMAVVIDATAGEKEKGTLEALLAAPVAHLELATGKMFAGLVFAVVTSISGLAGLLLGGALFRSLAQGETFEAMSGSFSLSFEATLLLFVTAVLYAAFITALLVAVGMYARSYKEAQTYVSPLYMVLIVPLLVLMFASDFLSQNLWLYALPVFNVYLAIDQIIKAQIGSAALLVTWLSSLIYVAAATYWASRNFSDEGVLFRN
ncbi:ABC-2 type transporter [Oceanithermus profundus DSM 14977]|uniref:ABC-2 type transporter n=1 Tax=Oceanithermus profundus (strain DSM 14977 / NBRC 100410 / VKM B-2274 / 506) TaxID=670487 RepID=E4U7T8_OCEP5|nr:ABC transporter permease [Oceanithermus profundus]ADR36537.1 ABC-2 type transporter [Oceanithermus profundus DSM 14977]